MENDKPVPQKAAPPAEEKEKKQKSFLKYEYVNQNQVVFTQQGHEGKTLEVFNNDELFASALIVDEIVIVNAETNVPPTHSLTWQFQK